MEEEKIGLTPTVLKAISESTKQGILRELASGPKIPTDISSRLNRSVPTILEHLAKLANAGLVERQEKPGKKFVFYALTHTGEDLISNRSRLSIVLYGSLALFALGIFLLTTGSYYPTPFLSAFDVRSMSSLGVISENAVPSQELPKSTPVPSLFALNIVVIAVLAVAFILLIFYLAKSRQMRIRLRLGV